MEKLLLLLLPLPFGFGFAASGPAPEQIPGEPVFAFADPAIIESSGLVARDGLVVTVNDSGDSNRIFTVDPTTGATVGVTRWQGDADDIESLAPADDGYVWVGDTGDNAGQRDHIEVAKVPFGLGEREVRAATYELVYPDGSQDAETLLTDPTTGRLYVVSKGFIGRLYAAPEQLDPDGPNELEPVDDVLGIATDGAFFPDGRHVMVRNYNQAAIYTWPALDRVALLTLPSQPQGEGLAISEDGEILLSSEGQGSEVLRIELPSAVRAELESDSPSASPSASPSPGAESGQSAVVVADEDRSWWPWVLGGVAGVAMVAVLVRSLRPR